MSPIGPPMERARLDAAFDVVAAHVSTGRASYAALAVARGDGLVRSGAWSADGPVDPPPRTAVASITKPITATSILQLVEAGSLVLTEPIATYVPGFAPEPPAGVGAALEPITAWHILTHTSGIPEARDEFLMSAPPTPEAQIERICRERLLFAPGSAYSYASESFYVLSELVGRLSGEPYPAFLRQRIFEPLGMTATTFDPSVPGPVARPLEGDFGPPGARFEDLAAYFAAMSMPGGGLWSTPEDVARFGRAMLLGGTLYGTRILGRPFVDLMTRLHTGSIDERDTGRAPFYALGWGLPGLGRGSPASVAAFGHTGATGSVLIVDPTYDLVVVYLRNEWGATTTATDEAVQAVYAALP